MPCLFIYFRSLPQDHIIVLEKPSTIAATSTPDHSMPSENVQKKVGLSVFEICCSVHLNKFQMNVAEDILLFAKSKLEIFTLYFRSN